MHIWMWCAAGIPDALSAGVMARMDEARIAGRTLGIADHKTIHYGQ